MRAGAANGALAGINPLMMEMVVKMQEAQTNNFQIMMNSHNQIMMRLIDQVAGQRAEVGLPRSRRRTKRVSSEETSGVYSSKNEKRKKVGRESH